MVIRGAAILFVLVVNNVERSQNLGELGLGRSRGGDGPRAAAPEGAVVVSQGAGEGEFPEYVVLGPACFLRNREDAGCEPGWL